jgi:hypothetical protein
MYRSSRRRPSLRFLPRAVALAGSCTVALACAPGISAGQTPGAAPWKPSATRADLTGLVSDSRGLPVTGATVYVNTAAPRTGSSPFCPSCYADCGKHEATSKQGRFRVRSMDCSLIFRLLVVKTGCEPTYVDHVDPLRSPIKVVLEKKIALPHGPKTVVEGRVLDPTGRPVVGATVEPIGFVTAKSTMYGNVANYAGVDPLTITDERGLFHFDCMESGCALTVLIKARGLASIAVPSVKAGARAPKRIIMPIGTTVEGTVEDAAGQRLAGVTVQLLSTDLETGRFVGWFDIGTDQHGKFRLPNVPAGQPYIAFVRMDNLADGGIGTVRQPFKTGQNGSVTGGLRLGTQPAARGTGEGVCTGGKPIPAGTRLMLCRTQTGGQPQVVLSGDGSFAFQGVPKEEDMEFVVAIRGYRYTEDTPGYDAIYHVIRLRVPSTATESDVRIELAPTRK